MAAGKSNLTQQHLSPSLHSEKQFSLASRHTSLEGDLQIQNKSESKWCASPSTCWIRALTWSDYSTWNMHSGGKPFTRQDQHGLPYRNI
ncbi:hypothetical protein MTO96_047830 [Rhipicephalus appendiculatus]